MVSDFDNMPACVFALVFSAGYGLGSREKGKRRKLIMMQRYIRGENEDSSLAHEPTLRAGVLLEVLEKYKQVQMRQISSVEFWLIPDDNLPVTDLEKHDAEFIDGNTEWKGVLGCYIYRFE